MFVIADVWRPIRLTIMRQSLLLMVKTWRLQIFHFRENEPKKGESTCMLYWRVRALKAPPNNALKTPMMVRSVVLLCQFISTASFCRVDCFNCWVLYLVMCTEQAFGCSPATTCADFWLRWESSWYYDPRTDQPRMHQSVRAIAGAGAGGTEIGKGWPLGSAAVSLETETPSLSVIRTDTLGQNRVCLLHPNRNRCDVQQDLKSPSEMRVGRSDEVDMRLPRIWRASRSVS